MGINANGKQLTAPRAVEVRKAGYALSVYTINDGDDARAIVGMGVDCVITDAPDVILQALGGRLAIDATDLRGCVRG